MKDILVENGVSEKKISILPNAVDSQQFGTKKDKRLEKDLDFQNKISGYIGSFVKYEGLDLLLEACAILRNKIAIVSDYYLVTDKKYKFKKFITLFAVRRCCAIHW